MFDDIATPELDHPSEPHEPVIRHSSARSRASLALAVITLVCANGIARAQQTSGKDNPPTPVLGDIIVTANGLYPDDSTPESGGAYVKTPSVGPLGDQDDRNVPFSTLSIPQLLILDQQAHSAAEVLKNDPSVIGFDMNGRAQQYIVRGFGVGPTYGIYKDGLDLMADSNPAIESTERVDIVRGAASVLYGFAAPGGLVQYQSKLPLDVPLTRVQVGYLSDASIGEGLDASRRFGPDDALGLRANVYEQDGDLDIQHTRQHRDVEALSGDWRVADSVKLWANIEHNRQILDGGNPSLFTASQATGTLTAPDPKQLYGQRFDTETIDTALGELGVNADFNGWKLQAAAGYARTDDSLLSVFNGNIGLDQSGQFDVVPTQGYFPYYSNAYRATLSRDLITGPVTQTFTLAVSGSNHAEFIRQNVYYNEELGTSSLADPQQFAQPPTDSGPEVYREDIKLSTQILMDRVDVYDYLTLLGGAVRSTVFDVFKQISDGTVYSDNDQNKVTPMAAVLVHPTDKMTVYGSFIQSLVPGSQAPGTAVNAFQLLPPYVGDQYELGIKAEPLPGFEVKSALFRVFEVSGILNAQNVYVAQGRQRNQGLEFTTTGKVLPNLTIFGGATILNAGIHDAYDSGYTRALDVPRLRANLYGELAIPQLPGFALLGGVFYTSATPIISNPPSVVAAGYPLLIDIRRALTGDVGARYAWSAAGVPLSVNAYISNVANAGYFIPSGSTVSVGPPRSFRLTLSASF